MAIAIGFKGSFVTALDNVPDPPILSSFLTINSAFSEISFLDSRSISFVFTTIGTGALACISVVFEESARHTFTPLLTHDSILQQLQFAKMSQFSFSMDSLQIVSQSTSNNFSVALPDYMINDFAIVNAHLKTTFHHTFTPLLVTRLLFQSFSFEKPHCLLCMLMPSLLEHKLPPAINNQFTVAARSVVSFETSVYHILTPPLVPLFKNILQSAFVSCLLLSLAMSNRKSGIAASLLIDRSAAETSHFATLSELLIYILLTPLLMYCVLILRRLSVSVLPQLHSLSSGCLFPVSVCL